MGNGITVSNTGNQPITPTFALAGHPAFILQTPNCPEVKGGATCSANVLFLPQSADLVTAQLTVTAPPAPGTTTAILTGRGYYWDAGAEAGVDGGQPDAGPD